MTSRTPTESARRVAGICLAAIALALTALAPAAGAAVPPRPLRLISSPSSGTDDAIFDGASADGRRVFFSTAEALLAGDRNTTQDIYERDADGTLRLITTGNGDAVTGNFDASFDGASADGSRVFFHTLEVIAGTGDGNTVTDVYERDSDGTVRLISNGSAGGRGGTFDGASADGSRVFFHTIEAIAGTGDGNAVTDVYERDSDGTLRLISSGSASGRGSTFDRASADGSRVFFHTTEAIAGTGDNDTGSDVYERDGGGTLRLVSTGDSGALGASFDGASADGSRVLFQTTEALTASDQNTATDIYERDADGTLRLVSSGSAANVNAFFNRASADGSRVFFHTTERIAGTGDNDTGSDVYERDADGTLRLVTTGDSGANGAFFDGASADGSRVFFETGEALTGTDQNGTFDTYERDADGTLRLISSGDAAGTGEFFDGASADGSRVFFRTGDAIPGTGDNDTAFDVYERDADGTLRLVSAGDSGTVDASFAGASADGSRVLFTTTEAIAGSGDSDMARDIYERALAVPSFASQANVSGTPKAGATLTCAPGAIVGESVTTAFAWLRDGAPIAGAGSATYVVAGSDAGHALACRVTATNPIGSASQTSAAVVIAVTGVVADHARPSVKLLTPACPRRATRRACAQLRARARSWRTLHGTVSDPKPSSGIARVEVNIVRTQGKRCSVYNGRRFVTVSCRTASKHYVRAKLLTHGRWTLALRTLPAGSYAIRVRATDRAGNTTAKPLTRKLKLR